MYAYLCKIGSGFFEVVCASGHRSPFSRDPPTLSERPEPRSTPTRLVLRFSLYVP